MGNKTKLKARFRRGVLGGVMLVLAGWPVLAGAEVHYRYRVTLRDQLGHHGEEMVCAINPARAKDKALAKWGHQGHHPGVVSIVKKGVCEPMPRPA